MECFCGCGADLPRDREELSLQAGRLALELLVWDKARAGDRPDSCSEEDERLIERGADCYSRLLLALHGQASAYSIDEGEAWLGASESKRRPRKHMTRERFYLFKRTEPLLDEADLARLDRVHPELSFSGDAAGDRGHRLERLQALHAEGVLSDDEFVAARERLRDGGG